MPSATVNDLRFDYDDSGPTDGDTVLALHGFPQDRTSWSALTPALTDAGFRVIAPDQRGYSPGARPPRTSDYRLGLIVDDALGLLDELGVGKAHVVGHDWGGAAAWALASAAPDRLRSLTVLSTPYPAAMTRVALRSNQLLKSWYMGLFQVPGLAERVLRPGGSGWRAVMRGLPAESVERYTRRAEQPGALTAMLRWYRALPSDYRSPSVAWHRISVPTLYVWGSSDPALGAAAAHATADYVTAEYTFVALAGQGHWLPERAAEQVAPLLVEHLLAHSP